MAIETNPARDIPTQTGKQSPGSAHRYVGELDGVRGIAILLVMLCHSYLILPVPSGLFKALNLDSVLFLGWSGVDLFFVLSGFLITGILLDTSAAQNHFSSFYLRRILRIVPLYVTAVYTHFHLVLPFARRLGFSTYGAENTERWFWFHLSNWPRAFGVNVGMLDHFWSLAIEEQFYLVWPVLVFLAGKKRLPHLCLGLIALSFGLRCAYAHHNFGMFFLYELTPFRIEPLVLGSLGALLVRDKNLLSSVKDPRVLAGGAACGLAALSAVLWAGKTTSFGAAPMATYGFTSFGVLYLCLVLYAQINSGSVFWLSRLLRSSGLRAFGKYSYAIYVIHLPLFKSWGFIARKASDTLPDQGKALFLVFAMVSGIGLSYLGSLISWNLLEKHFLRLKDRFAPRYDQTVGGRLSEAPESQ